MLEHPIEIFIGHLGADVEYNSFSLKKIDELFLLDSEGWDGQMLVCHHCSVQRRVIGNR
jgi:hypothetical protein